MGKKETKVIKESKPKDTINNKVELNAKRIDTLSKGMDMMKDLLDRIAKRMGIE